MCHLYILRYHIYTSISSLLYFFYKFMQLLPALSILITASLLVRYQVILRTLNHWPTSCVRQLPVSIYHRTFHTCHTHEREYSLLRHSRNPGQSITYPLSGRNSAIRLEKGASRFLAARSARP